MISFLSPTDAFPSPFYPANLHESLVVAKEVGIGSSSSSNCSNQILVSIFHPNVIPRRTYAHLCRLEKRTVRTYRHENGDGWRSENRETLPITRPECHRWVTNQTCPYGVLIQDPNRPNVISTNNEVNPKYFWSEHRTFESVNCVVERGHVLKGFYDDQMTTDLFQNVSSQCPNYVKEFCQLKDKSVLTWSAALGAQCGFYYGHDEALPLFVNNYGSSNFLEDNKLMDVNCNGEVWLDDTLSKKNSASLLAVKASLYQGDLVRPLSLTEFNAALAKCGQYHHQAFAVQEVPTVQNAIFNIISPRIRNLLRHESNRK